MSPYAAKTLKPRNWIDPEKRRDNSAQRGYGSAWRKTRGRILERDPVCVICHLKPSNTVDHILSCTKGGSDDDSNLRGLCGLCHSRKTVQVDDRWGKR
jgi:5-methylcytosine-specific restriction protein A